MPKSRRLFLMARMIGICAFCVFSLHPALAAETSAAEEGDPDDSIKGGRFKNDPVYVHIAPLTLPIINEKGVEQLVTLLIDVQVPDLETASLLQASMPRVIDSLLQHLYGKLSDGDVRSGKMVNVRKVKREAAAAVSNIIGAKNVKDVLVQGVSQRML